MCPLSYQKFTVNYRFTRFLRRWRCCQVKNPQTQNCPFVPAFNRMDNDSFWLGGWFSIQSMFSSSLSCLSCTTNTRIPPEFGHQFGFCSFQMAKYTLVGGPQSSQKPDKTHRDLIPCSADDTKWRQRPRWLNEWSVNVLQNNIENDTQIIYKNSNLEKELKNERSCCHRSFLKAITSSLYETEMGRVSRPLE